MSQDIKVYELAAQILLAVISVILAPVVAALLKVWTVRAIRRHRARGRGASKRGRVAAATRPRPPDVE